YLAQILFSFLFFFQAEDGIRDFHVTGVQTCALPIWMNNRSSPSLLRTRWRMAPLVFHSRSLISALCSASGACNGQSPSLGMWLKLKACGRSGPSQSTQPVGGCL